MNILLSYIRTWLQAYEIPIGIIIISGYFLSCACLNIMSTIQNQIGFLNLSVFEVVVLAGTLISPIGLMLKLGWAWNYTIFINTTFLFQGFLSTIGDFLTTGKYESNIKLLIIMIIINLILHIPVYYYLYKTEIKNLYQKSPISLITIGFFLSSYNLIADSQGSYINLFWQIMSIVGLAIMFKAGKDFKEQYQSNQKKI